MPSRSFMNILIQPWQGALFLMLFVFFFTWKLYRELIKPIREIRARRIVAFVVGTCVPGGAALVLWIITIVQVVQGNFKWIS